MAVSLYCLLAVMIVICQVDIAATAIVFVSDPVSPKVEENSAVGVTVVTITATEPDKTFNYTLVSQTPNTPADTFAVASATGVVTTKRANIDFETNKQYVIVIKSTDTGDGSSTGTTNVTIKVTDVKGPAFAMPTYTACVNTNSSAGTFVLAVVATPANTSDTLTYSISGGNTGTVFSMNTSSIQVAAAKTVAKSPAKYNLVLTAVAAKTPTETGTTNVTVTVGDPCPRSYAATVMLSFHAILICVIVAAFNGW